jgi:O-acetyl-ADP-ribose deacetylase (regulator of RNase III)
MTKLEQLIKLNQWLLDDMPQYQAKAEEFPITKEAQWRLFRSLVNVREPCPISDEFLKLQNAFLQNEIKDKGIMDISDLTSVREEMNLWQGDITTLKVDAIVNAANSGMTGCYCPLHGCIDNAIHTFAGVQLRQACAEIMQRQRHEEATGQAKITSAFNLPSKYVLHTVGPIISGEVTQQDCELLSSCHRSCLMLADEHQLKSIAFCCISTGEYHFPNDKAAEIAVQTVRDYRLQINSKIKVIFNVFKDKDYEIYKRMLG